MCRLGDILRKQILGENTACGQWLLSPKEPRLKSPLSSSLLPSPPLEELTPEIQLSIETFCMYGMEKRVETRLGPSLCYT